MIAQKKRKKNVVLKKSRTLGKIEWRKLNHKTKTEIIIEPKMWNIWGEVAHMFM